jgi:hypothetical protein
MRIELIFPITLIVLDILASLAYLFIKDYRLALYWFSASILTVCVTIGK